MAVIVQYITVNGENLVKKEKTITQQELANLENNCSKILKT